MRALNDSNRLLSRLSFLIVPALAITGFVSALVSERLWFQPIGVHGSEFLFHSLQSVLLGLALCAVLLAFQLIRGWGNLALVMMVIVAAHCLEQFVDARLPRQDFPCWDCSPDSFFTWDVALRFFMVSLIVFVASARAIEPRAKPPILLLVSAAGALLGSVVLGVLDSWAQWDHAELVLNGSPLSLLWQPTLAAFLGVVVWIAAGGCSQPESR